MLKNWPAYWLAFTRAAVFDLDCQSSAGTEEPFRSLRGKDTLAIQTEDAQQGSSKLNIAGITIIKTCSCCTPPQKFGLIAIV